MGLKVIGCAERQRPSAGLPAAGGGLGYPHFIPPLFPLSRAAGAGEVKESFCGRILGGF